MRVISGTAKGRKLKRVPGDSTRPIMDRVKENLFNILSDFVPDSRWLDLFAGTGQVGIEALSRGAEGVLFIDNVRAAICTIEANLKHTGLIQKAQIAQIDAFRYLDSPFSVPFDLVYVAPPQYKNLWKKVLLEIDRQPTNFLNADGIIVVQIDPNEYGAIDLINLIEYDRRRYGSTMLCFYELADRVT